MTATIQTRVDASLKEKADKIINSMGLDMTTAIRMFLTQVIEQRKIPFEIKAPEELSLDDCQFEDLNEETQSALLESQAICNGKIKAKSYDSFKDALNDIGLLDVAEDDAHL